jgi:hypothetical protein
VDHDEPQVAAFAAQEDDTPAPLAEIGEAGEQDAAAASESLPDVTVQQIEKLFHGYRAERWVNTYLDLQVERGELLPNDRQAAKKYLLGGPWGNAAPSALPEVLTEAPSGGAPDGPAEQTDITPSLLAVSLSALNFGSVRLNETKELAFQVSNQGTVPLSGNITVAAPHTVVAGEEFTLAPGASQTVVLRFQPTTPGVFLSNATVYSDHGIASISLRGVGQRG